MTHLLDIDSFEVAETRAPRKKAPTNTNPLAFDAAELATLENVSGVIDTNLKINGLSTYHQFLAFHCAMNGIKAALAGDWSALAGAAETGLSACSDIQMVSPYLICKQDEAKRNLASDQRAALKDMALRLGQAAPAGSKNDEDLARCLRAMTCAAICADRGLIHFVKENFGVVMVILGSDDFAKRREVPLTEGIVGLSRRFRQAIVRMP